MFENLGTIQVQASQGLVFQFGTPPVGRMDVRADRIFSPGRIRSTTASVIRMEGQDVDLERGAISTFVENSNQFSFFPVFDTRPTNYNNPLGVEDVYWAAGRGGRLQAGQANVAIQLDSNPFPPSPVRFTPFHEVVWPALQSVSALNFYSQTNYTSYVWTNVVNFTNRVIQVVLVNTNTLAPNITSTSDSFRMDFMPCRSSGLP